MRGNWDESANAAPQQLDATRSSAPGVESFARLRALAVEVEVPHVGAVGFAGYEDLQTMKRAAGRPEDQRDLDELRAIRRQP
ncbi:MAG TPA: hypothetical protein VF101_12335 [Gaiellaceae bacterium]